MKSIFNSLKEAQEKKTHLAYYVESKHIFYALWKIIVRDKRVTDVDVIDFSRSAPAHSILSLFFSLAISQRCKN